MTRKELEKQYRDAVTATNEAWHKYEEAVHLRQQYIIDRMGRRFTVLEDATYQLVKLDEQLSLQEYKSAHIKQLELKKQYLNVLMDELDN